MRKVMVGLVLIGAASAAWEGQGNAPTVRLDPSLWDSLKPGQYRLLDDDVVVARTTRGVFFWRPSALPPELRGLSMDPLLTPIEAHGTGANRNDAALDKIQAALDSILGRGVPPPLAPKPPAKGRREPEDADDDDLSDAALDRIQAELDRALTDAQPPPPPAKKLSNLEVAGRLLRLQGLIRAYTCEKGQRSRQGLVRVVQNLAAQASYGYDRLVPELYQYVQPLKEKDHALYDELEGLLKRASTTETA